MAIYSHLHPSLAHPVPLAIGGHEKQDGCLDQKHFTGVKLTAVPVIQAVCSPTHSPSDHGNWVLSNHHLEVLNDKIILENFNSGKPSPTPPPPYPICRQSLVHTPWHRDGDNLIDRFSALHQVILCPCFVHHISLFCKIRCGEIT